jgi:predicted DNA-binding transcriptional regulator AlpA
VNEAARMLGVSASWLHHRPQLPFRRKIGGRVKFSRTGIERWCQRDHPA